MGWSFRRTKSLGLYYRPSLLDARQLLPRETPPYRISPLGISSVVIVVGLIIYGISSSAPANASANVVSVMQTVAPVAAPVMKTVAPVAVSVTVTHVTKQHKGKHAIHRRAPVTSLEPDDMLAAEPVDAVLD
jgi:hypothetical protein